MAPVTQPVGGNLLGGLNGAFGTAPVSGMGGFPTVNQPAMGFNVFGTTPIVNPPVPIGIPATGLTSINLLGGPASQPIQPAAQPATGLMGPNFNLGQAPINTGGFDLLGGLGSISSPPVPQPVQPIGGLNLLGGPSQPTNTGFNLLASQPQPQPQNIFLASGFGTATSNTSSFKAY